MEEGEEGLGIDIEIDLKQMALDLHRAR